MGTSPMICTSNQHTEHSLTGSTYARPDVMAYSIA